jgi:hypothetical protein
VRLKNNCEKRDWSISKRAARLIFGAATTAAGFGPGSTMPTPSDEKLAKSMAFCISACSAECRTVRDRLYGWSAEALHALALCAVYMQTLGVEYSSSVTATVSHILQYIVDTDAVRASQWAPLCTRFGIKPSTHALPKGWTAHASDKYQRYYYTPSARLAPALTAETTTWTRPAT